MDTHTSLLSPLLALVIVLLAIAAAAWLLRRVGPGRVAQNNLLRLVGQLPVGPHEKVSIVAVGDQWLVLGVTANNVTLLTETAAREISGGATEGASTGAFSQLLANLRRPVAPTGSR